jgi:hypothetical protein
MHEAGRASLSALKVRLPGGLLRELPNKIRFVVSGKAGIFGLLDTHDYLPLCAFIFDIEGCRNPPEPHTKWTSCFASVSFESEVSKSSGLLPRVPPMELGLVAMNRLDADWIVEGGVIPLFGINERRSGNGIRYFQSTSDPSGLTRVTMYSLPSAITRSPTVGMRGGAISSYSISRKPNSQSCVGV